MDERLARLEARLRSVDEALAAMCARLDALEQRSAIGVADETSPVPLVATGRRMQTAGEDSAAVLRILTLAGRTFLVLGGAYLLRSLTDTGTVSPVAGVALGLTYASTWIGAADHTALRRPASGFFHGLAALLIGCPLLLEASTRFGVLSAGAAAGLLALLVTVALAVAWHRDLQALAGTATIAGSLTAIVLSHTTHQIIPFALVAILVAATTAASRFHRGWAWPERVAALAAIVLVLEAIALAHGTVPYKPLAALAIALLLSTLYLTMVTVSVSAKLIDLSLADVSLWLLPIVVGVAGAFSTARIIGPPTVEWLGGAFLAMGIAGYVVSFANEARWSDRGLAVLTSLACAMLIIGTLAGLPDGSMDVLGGLLGLVLMTAGVRSGRAWFIAQGAILTIAAVAASRLIGLIAVAWIGALPVSPPSPTASIALAALIGGLGLLLWSPHRSGVSQTASFALAVIAASGIGAMLIVLFNGGDGTPGRAGSIAALRSVVLAALAVAMAALARHRQSAEVRWVTYTFMGLGALKLAIEDIRVSSPLALFVALAAYGAALIASSRFLTRRLT